MSLTGVNTVSWPRSIGRENLKFKKNEAHKNLTNKFNAKSISISCFDKYEVKRQNNGKFDLLFNNIDSNRNSKYSEKITKFNDWNHYQSYFNFEQYEVYCEEPPPPPKKKRPIRLLKGIREHCQHHGEFF